MENKFYETFIHLCEEKGVKPTKACTDGIGPKSKNTWTRWRDGTGNPTLDSLLKLSQYFGVTVSELMGETENPTTVVGDGFEGLSDKKKEFIRLLSRLTDQEVDSLSSYALKLILGQ